MVGQVAPVCLVCCMSMGRLSFRLTRIRLGSIRGRGTYRRICFISKPREEYFILSMQVGFSESYRNNNLTYSD
jgi:hypothetical protein